MKKIDNRSIIFFSTMLYYICAYIADTIPGGIVILILSLALMCFVFVTDTNGIIRLKQMGFLKYIVVFLAFCFASRLWAENPNLTAPKVNALLFIFIAMLVIHYSNLENAIINEILKAVMYGGYFISFYIIARYGFSGVLQLVSDNLRISNEVLNSNTIGMCAAYSIVINLYFVFYERIKPRDILMLPALIILIVSRSRKAIILIILGIIGIYVLKNLKRKGFGLFLVKLFGGIIAIVIFLIVASKLPFLQPVVGRIEDIGEMLLGEGTRGNNTAWIRFAYVNLGIDLFRKNPFFGIGIGNANIYTQILYGHNHYLHNNFVELLACGGLVGFLIYYSMHLYLLISFICLWKYRDREYDICLVLLFIVLVLDYGMVSYYNKTNYLMLFIIWKKIKQLQISKAEAGSRFIEESGLSIRRE